MVDSNNAIEVTNVVKNFKVYYDKGRMLKERAIKWSRNKYEERTVLDGISFNIKKGEAVGFVGHNGCGKSTTLKLLTRIMYPDSGTIEIAGRVSSLLELGAGFHPDLSGRENIYINASIYGLGKKEIDKRINDIIDFSELEEFIDNPIRTYSSGMYTRLAFSVAINVDADVLLIDEILAVGDANFQAKCFNKLMEIKNEGTTIVIVSHSLGQIEQICERSIWIHEGKIKAEGKPRSVHQEYLAYMGELRNQQSEIKKVELEDRNENSGNLIVQDTDTKYKHVGNKKIIINNVETLDKKGKIKSVFATTEDVVINVKLKVNSKVKNANIGISIFRNDGICCYATSTKQDAIEPFEISKDGNIKFILNDVALLSGKYEINVGIEDEHREGIDYVDKACCFEIYTINDEIGAFYLDHRWKIGELR